MQGKEATEREAIVRHEASEARWFHFSLALLGFLLGGGVAGAIGSYQYEKLRDEVSNARALLRDEVIAEVAIVEAKEAKNLGIIISMSERLVRIETKLDALTSD